MFDRVSAVEERRWTNPYINLVQSHPDHLVHAERGALTDVQCRDLQDGLSRWGEVYCEVGCGSGGHLCRRAALRPAAFFLGFELRYKRAFNTAKKANREKLFNLKVVRGDAHQLLAVFGEQCLDGLYVNFPDPWSKRRWLKHRMLSADFLRAVHQRLKPGGFVSYKTDHAGYFEATEELLGELGIFRIAKFSRDLHRSEYVNENIYSEFELLFRSKGRPVFFLQADKAAD